MVTRTSPIYVALVLRGRPARLVGSRPHKQLDTDAGTPGPGPAGVPDRGQLTAGAWTIQTPTASEITSADRPANYTAYWRGRWTASEQQSQELDRNKRLTMVSDIQRTLEAEVARPLLGWRKSTRPYRT